MNRIKQFKIAAIAVMVLGCIHVCATPVVLPMFSQLTINQLLTFTYMFVFTGIFIIFLGWLQWFICKQIQLKHYYKILKISTLTLAFVGIASVATMWDNPFAYLSLFLALYELILLKSILTSKQDT